jgi:hypothetical protein
MARVFPWVMTGLIVAGLGAGAWALTGSLILAGLAALGAASFVRPGQA